MMAMVVHTMSVYVLTLRPMYVHTMMVVGPLGQGQLFCGEGSTQSSEGKICS